MKIKRAGFFPDRQKKTLIDIGDEVESRVVSVGSKQITVEIQGVETMIKPEELTYRHIADYTQEFLPGDLVMCKVLDIKLGSSKERAVEIEASVKQTGPDPRAIAINNYKEKGSYMCTVTFISEIGIFATICEDLQVYCHFPQYGPRPEHNDKVLVTLQNINTADYKIQGRIRKIMTAHE